MNPDIINIKRPWTLKRSIVIAIISIVLGILCLSISYISAKNLFGFNNINQPVLDYIMTIRQVGLTDLMSTITVFGSYITIIALTLSTAIIWISYKKELWRPSLLISAVATMAGAMLFLKSWFAISRPAASFMIMPIETDFSFPSGHTLMIFIYLIVLGYLICSRRSSFIRLFIWGAATFILTSIIASSRLYLGYHWLTDIFASIGIGLILFSIIIFIDKAVTHRFTRLQ